MTIGEQKRDYHAARARAELESAYRAARPESAAVHLELSSLHLRKALSFGIPFGQRPPSDLGWLQSFAPAHDHWLRPDTPKGPLATGPAEHARSVPDDERRSDRRGHLSLRWPGTVEATA